MAQRTSKRRPLSLGYLLITIGNRGHGNCSGMAARQFSPGVIRTPKRFVDNVGRKLVIFSRYEFFSRQPRRDDVYVHGHDVPVGAALSGWLNK